jgi:hypothetical protein
LPRYLSYSLMRYMDLTAASNGTRNGGGWFDPYECYSFDTYLEQAYLTAFAKARELMLFCWPSLYNNKLATPLGFQLRRIDEALTETGFPQGLPVYLPHNAQGEDHLEDYLGMAGIPFDPTPVFPGSNEASTKVMVTAMALHDPDIVRKIKRFAAVGGTVVATAGFIIGALVRGLGIEEMTSIRYRGRRVQVAEYHVPYGRSGRMHYCRPDRPIGYPLLEHRNNASWSLMNGGDGEQHCSLIIRDTYGEGELITLNVPDLYSDIKRIPSDALTAMRKALKDGQIYIEGNAGTSLFTYSGCTFALYTYTTGGVGDNGSEPGWIKIHIDGKANKLHPLGEKTPWTRDVLPLYCTTDETVFEVRVEPGNWQFYSAE